MMLCKKAKAIGDEESPGELHEIKDNCDAAPEPRFNWRKLICIFLLVGISAGVLSVGLGVGFGLGLKKRSTSTTYITGSGTAKRTYYIQAEYIMWDYATGGDNACFNGLPAGMISSDAGIPLTNVGGIFKKAIYQEYTDYTFTTKKARPADEVHLGNLGPLLRAEAGDTLEVVLKNALSFDINLEPMGASNWSPAGQIDTVAAGSTALITWQVPKEAGPTNFDVDTGRANGMQSSRLYLYRSSVDPVAHDNAGLLGPIIVTASGAAHYDGSTMDVDRDIIVVMQMTQESLSPLVEFNGLLSTTQGMSFTKMTMNGFLWCTQKGFDAVIGERVRWHVASVGGADSGHNLHWHGNTFLRDGRRTDGVSLVGGQTASLDMSNDDAGTWLMHCHVNYHLDGGMILTYTVSGDSVNYNLPASSGGVERVYYIAAEEVEWDYAPLGGEACSGTVEPFGEDASVFLGEPEGIRIGSKYIKGMFVQYTDGNFTTPVERSGDDAYLGILGPVMRARVGDVIKVHFLNRLRYQATVHPHGVFYTKANEGTPYVDGTSGANQADDAIPPNGTYTYMWEVPERAGPGPKDPSSLMWMYHSHTDESKDVYTGLLGAIIVSRADNTTASNSTTTSTTSGYVDVGESAMPTDVDREVVLMFMVVNEAASLFEKDNLEKYMDPSLWNTSDALTALEANAEYAEASLKHAINGRMYCNMGNLSFVAGERIRFHVMALGSQEDVHTPNIAGGGSFLSLGQSQGQGHSSSMALLAGGMASVDVIFTQPGNWSLTCRVLDHVVSGMHAIYEVTDAPDGPLAVAGGTERVYYVAAEQVTWDYAPSGYVSGCVKQNLRWTAYNYISTTARTIGSQRTKALFRHYKDANLTTLVDRPEYFGLLGPLIAAEVGDVITVVLTNRLNFSINFTPDGGLVELGDHSGGKEIEPNATFTFRWVVPKQAGPLDDELNTVPYTYASTLDYGGHQAAGLVGLMIIASPGTLSTYDGYTPSGVDLFVPLLFQMFDENLSPFLEDDIAAAGIDDEEAEELMDDLTFTSSNQMHSINGYIYCNLPNLQIPLGSLVRFVFLSFGSEEAVNGPRVVGQQLVEAGGPVQSQILLPAMAQAIDMIASGAVGSWPILSDNHVQLEGGMYAVLNTVLY